MPSTFHLDAGWLTSSVIAIAFAILYPLALGFIAHRRLNISWKYLGYGALIFFLFQIISRRDGLALPALPVFRRSWF